MPAPSKNPILKPFTFATFVAYFSLHLHIDKNWIELYLIEPVLQPQYGKSLPILYYKNVRKYTHSNPPVSYSPLLSNVSALNFLVYTKLHQYKFTIESSHCNSSNYTNEWRAIK